MRMYAPSRPGRFFPRKQPKFAGTDGEGGKQSAAWANFLAASLLHAALGWRARLFPPYPLGNREDKGGESHLEPKSRPAAGLKLIHDSDKLRPATKRRLVRHPSRWVRLPSNLGVGRRCSPPLSREAVSDGCASALLSCTIPMSAYGIQHVNWSLTGASRTQTRG